MVYEVSWRRNIWNRLLPALGILASVIVSFGATFWPGPARLPGLPVEFRLIAIILALAALVIIMVRSPVIPPFAGHPGRPVFDSPSPDEIQDAEDDMVARYSIEALTYFVQLQLRLNEYLVQVDETVMLRERRLEIETRLTFRKPVQPKSITASEGSPEAGPGASPGPPATTFIVPVAQCAPGALMHGFRVLDASGGAVPILSYRDTYGLVSLTVRALVSAALLAAEKSGNVRRQYDIDQDDRTIRDLIHQVVSCQFGVADQCITGYEQVLRRIRDLSPAFSTEWKEILRSACEGLMKSCAVVVELVESPGSNVLLSYVQRPPLVAPSRSAVGRFRASIGLSPFFADVVLSRVLQADSYRFQMDAPSGHYVFRQELVSAASDQPLMHTDFHIGGRQQYVQVDHDSRPPGACIDIRRSGKAPLRQKFSVKAVIQFREIPPGTCGLAVVLTSISTLMIVLIAVTGVGLGGTGPGGNTDVTALLLAAPALAGAALSHWVAGERVVRSSLVSYLGLTGATVLSAASAVVYLWDASRANVDQTRIQIFGGTWSLPLTNSIWLVLGIIGTSSVLYLGYTAHHELRYFMATGQGGREVNIAGHGSRGDRHID